MTDPLKTAAQRLVDWWDNPQSGKVFPMGEAIEALREALASPAPSTSETRYCPACGTEVTHTHPADNACEECSCPPDDHWDCQGTGLANGGHGSLPPATSTSRDATPGDTFADGWRAACDYWTGFAAGHARQSAKKADRENAARWAEAIASRRDMPEPRRSLKGQPSPTPDEGSKETP